MKTLKRLREERNLTPRQLAKCLGVSHSGYVYIERGKHEARPEMLKKLADFFNIPLDDMGMIQKASCPRKTEKTPLRKIEKQACGPAFTKKKVYSFRRKKTERDEYEKGGRFYRFLTECSGAGVTHFLFRRSAAGCLESFTKQQLMDYQIEQVKNRGAGS